MTNKLFLLLGLLASCFAIITLNDGCAQISAPSGGAKDTIPPRLVKATPPQNTILFTGKKVGLSFNEYIDLQELQNNLIISPYQKNSPVINFNLKSVNIKFKDSLLPNTTYSVNFGDAIRDVHEGNILKNFSYVFSTGATIDSLTLQGNVILAETGKVDSTIMVMLYHNTADSAVTKLKPDYITKINGKGDFTFNHLPPAAFKLYALKDGDGGKTYNAKTELFAFYDSSVDPSKKNVPIQLFAYAEEKQDKNKNISVLKPKFEKKLKYSTNLTGQLQDLLLPLELNFNNPIQLLDTLKVILADTNHHPLQHYAVSIDSTRKKVTVQTKWKPETYYSFIIPKDAIKDSAGNYLTKADTLSIKTSREEDYGTVLLRFTNLDLSLHPVIQFTDGENIKYSFPVLAKEWSNKRFPPGEYSLRILYDRNNNGVWDRGNYDKKIQPEKTISLDLKLSIRADWDNERDIKL